MYTRAQKKKKINKEKSSFLVVAAYNGIQAARYKSVCVCVRLSRYVQASGASKLNIRVSPLVRMQMRQILFLSLSLCFCARITIDTQAAAAARVYRYKYTRARAHAPQYTSEPIYIYVHHILRVLMPERGMHACMHTCARGVDRS